MRDGILPPWVQRNWHAPVYAGKSGKVLGCRGSVLVGRSGLTASRINAIEDDDSQGWTIKHKFFLFLLPRSYEILHLQHAQDHPTQLTDERALKPTLFSCILCGPCKGKYPGFEFQGWHCYGKKTFKSHIGYIFQILRKSFFNKLHRAISHIFKRNALSINVHDIHQWDNNKYHVKAELRPVSAFCVYLSCCWPLFLFILQPVVMAWILDKNLLLLILNMCSSAHLLFSSAHSQARRWYPLKDRCPGLIHLSNIETVYVWTN